jgi:hypothetical protein
MVNAYQIPQAKGLYGAVLIQYIIYGFLYIIEGAKIREIKDAENAKNMA